MKFRPGQVLEKFETDGKEVVFRMPKRSDLKGCMKHINLLVKEKAYLATQKKVTLKQEREWLNGVMKEIGGKNAVNVFVTIDGKYAGNARIEKHKMDSTGHVAEIGITLSLGRGMGIGTRLMALLEKIARNHFKSRILRLDVYEGNTPAKRLYKKMGFKKIGVIPKGCKHFGRYLDYILMYKELK